MAEAIISPGVFLNENDLSQIAQGPVVAGAALVGPAVKGPVNYPVVVTSYSDFTSKFGAVFPTGSSTEEYLTSLAVYNYFQQGGETMLITRVVSGSIATSPNGNYLPASASIAATGSGITSFVLETLSVGVDQDNSAGAETAVTGGFLPSGSVNNIRWEIASTDVNSGLFSLIIRRGDDSTKSKKILETWSNLSLDPNSANYIEYQIGNMSWYPSEDENGDWQLISTGSYANKSRYVRVQSVSAQPGYFNANGTPNNDATSSLPALGSGSLQGTFGGASGDLYGGQTAGNVLKLFENITTSASPSYANNIQGLIPSNYDVAFSLLKNKDWYDYEVIYAPGLNLQNAALTLETLINNTEERGDAIVVVDTTSKNQSVSTAANKANTVDSSYAATYWPWVQLRSNETGKMRWAPAATIIPGVYAYNDKVSAEWFAPAGLNRGGLPTVIGPEYRLTKSNRDTLYTNKVNPIAIFPGQGTVVYGQKTLQTAATALDRVNVRRLLIELKRQIGAVAENFLFEQNTVATRAKFVNQITPYLDSVQQRQGLYAYRVIMDETNNTPDVIDRNQMVGVIQLQPTRTAEFIILDFNILPTGATFGQ
jgi:hypothetical protein